MLDVTSQRASSLDQAAVTFWLVRILRVDAVLARCLAEVVEDLVAVRDRVLARARA